VWRQGWNKRDWTHSRGFYQLDAPPVLRQVVVSVVSRLVTVQSESLRYVGRGCQDPRLRTSSPPPRFWHSNRRRFKKYPPCSHTGQSNRVGLKLAWSGELWNSGMQTKALESSRRMPPEQKVGRSNRPGRTTPFSEEILKTQILAEPIKKSSISQVCLSWANLDRARC